MKTHLQAVGDYLQQHPDLVLAAVQELTTAATPIDPAITTPTTAESSIAESSTAARGTYYHFGFGRVRSRTWFGSDWMVNSTALGSSRHPDIPDFNSLQEVPSGVRGARAKLGKEFVSRQIARGLWAEQKITIGGILADVEPHEEGFCRRCKADGKQECMVLKDCEVNYQVLKPGSCANCIRAGQSCVR